MGNLMNDLILFRKENFNGVECDLWKDVNNQIWMTREQIGKSLEYGNPRESIKTIHSRNKERLDKFSKRVQIDTPSNGKQETYLYSAKGIYEVCRFSKQPKANDFYDWVYDLLEGLRLGNIELKFSIPQTYSEALQLASDLSKQLEDQKPKVEMYDQLINSDSLLNFKQVADTFGVCGRNSLIKLLREERILSSNGFNWNLPYVQYKKYFEVKIVPRRTNKGLENICTTLCTSKSLEFIKTILDKKKDLSLEQVN
jgi:phage antirepressor YoqD-like protein